MNADIKTELPKPWGYARNVDGRIQISVGPDRPPCNERGSGYFTPWAAMYGGDMMIAYAELAVLEAAPASSAMAIAIDCLNKISEFCPHDSSVDQLDDSPEMQRRLHDAEIGDTARSAIAALQPQQSPVQASDAGRQG